MAGPGDYQFEIDPGFYDLLDQRLHAERERHEREDTFGSFARSLFGGPSSSFWRGLNPFPRTRACFEELPSREDLAQLVNTAFWASLSKEENRSVRFNLGYYSVPTPPGEGVSFAAPLKYSVAALAKLAPSCGSNGALLVCPGEDGLEIFGRAAAWYSALEIKVLDPGQLVVRGSMNNVAAISGSEILFIRDYLMGLYGEIWDRFMTRTPDGKLDVEDERRVALINAARRIRGLGHGGAIFVIANDDCLEKCISEFTYRAKEGVGALKEALDMDAELKAQGDLLTDGYATGIQAAAEDLAQMTQVDGAVLVREDLSLVGFGAKLTPANGNELETVYEVDPLHRSTANYFRVAESLGGTRHRSAARFIQDNPDALAIVVSEDGVISCFVSREVDGARRVVRYKRLELSLF